MALNTYTQQLGDNTPITQLLLDEVWEDPAERFEIRQILMTIAMMVAVKGAWRPKPHQLATRKRLNQLQRHVYRTKDGGLTLTIKGLEKLCSTPTLDIDGLMTVEIERMRLGHQLYLKRSRGSRRSQVQPAPLWEADSWDLLVTLDAVLAEALAAQQSESAA